MKRASFAFALSLAALAARGDSLPSIAFPAAGQRLPNVERAYMIGSVPRGATNIVVQGRNVEVYRTGAWATMVDVAEGTNTVEVAFGGLATNHVFHVAFKPAPAATGGNAGPAAAPQPPKEWKKLDYCGDEPKPHPAGRQPSEVTIVIDPGHGGSDTGAVSPHGLYEKNANLLQASAVRAELERRGYRVLMTRSDDRALVLTERPRLAHSENADAFVSIHHNAPAANQDPSTARYTAVYAWNPLGDALAEAIAARLGLALEGEIPSKGRLHANFAVTRNPEIPSCLVEVDFITSPAGEEGIFSPVRRRFLAEAIADGIEDWIGGGR